MDYTVRFNAELFYSARLFSFGEQLCAGAPKKKIVACILFAVHFFLYRKKLCVL